MNVDVLAAAPGWAQATLACRFAGLGLQQQQVETCEQEARAANWIGAGRPPTPKQIQPQEWKPQRHKVPVKQCSDFFPVGLHGQDGVTPAPGAAPPLCGVGVGKDLLAPNS